MSTGLAPERHRISAVSMDELRDRLADLIDEARINAAASLSTDPQSFVAGIDLGTWQAYEEVLDILNGQDAEAGSVGHA